MLRNATIVVSGTPSRVRFPWMTLTISLACAVIALLNALLDPVQQQIVFDTMGASPEQTTALMKSANHTGASWWSLPLSLFFHSNALHLLGNLTYLWVFGLPVERRLGPLFVLFVFVSGGVLAHVLLAVQMPGLERPVIGASGAVSAIVGACTALFPTRRMGLYVPLGIVIEFIRVPTLLVVGSWFGLQLLYSVFGPTSTTVAWWTHLAGFSLGVMIALLALAAEILRRGRRPAHNQSRIE